jgi:hypothetical protein
MELAFAWCDVAFWQHIRPVLPEFDAFSSAPEREITIVESAWERAARESTHNFQATVARLHTDRYPGMMFAHA